MLHPSCRSASRRRLHQRVLPPLQRRLRKPANHVSRGNHASKRHRMRIGRQSSAKRFANPENHFNRSSLNPQVKVQRLLPSNQPVIRVTEQLQQPTNLRRPAAVKVRKVAEAARNPRAIGRIAAVVVAAVVIVIFGSVINVSEDATVVAVVVDIGNRVVAADSNHANNIRRSRLHRVTRRSSGNCPTRRASMIWLHLKRRRRKFHQAAVNRFSLMNSTR
jgi:hypothetical protein